MNTNRFSWIVWIIFLLPVDAFPQTGGCTVKGQAVDTSGNPLALASVIVMTPVDSTLVSFAQGNDQGYFSVPRLRPGSYLVKISYVGYLPAILPVDLRADAPVRDLGRVMLKEISRELFEVVIKTAKAPMTIRGDTIEYDASKFKVPEGSTVEDLLRHLPGIEVSQDGTISTEGQEIRKVTVDGKRFFGGDPKAATKNLPAEGISKVQLYNDETEEKKLTGASSAPPEKAMNLTLKDDFKNGAFGKLIAAAGTEERAELKGNYNRFNESQQFSVIGSGNNTGRNGLSWDDYQDFRGSQSFNWNDETDFGFGGGGEYFIYYNEDDGSLQSNFFGNRMSGLPVNGSGGLNYSRFNKKSELNAVYFANYNELFAEATRNQENFLPGLTYSNRDTTRRTQIQRGHQAQARFEHKFDSLHSLVVSVQGRTSLRSLYNDGSYRYFRDATFLSNESRFDNLGRNAQNNGSASFIFRKKYRKQGRSSAVSGSFLGNGALAENEIRSDNVFYFSDGAADSLSSLHQINETVNQGMILKSSLLHVEPLGKKFFVQSFYNVVRRLESTDRDVFDLVQDTRYQNPFLSRYFDNTIQLHRLGTSLRYSQKGINISLGIARQLFSLEGKVTGGITSEVRRDFYNWIPNFSFNSSARKNQYFNLNYSVSAREPRIQDLQPVVDNSNPLYIREGNPDLIPQIDHRVNLGFRVNNPIRFTNFNVNLNFNAAQNQFVQEQIVDSNLVTLARTINYKGGNNTGIWTNFGFPVIKTKLTVNLSASSNLGQSFALVNAVENETFSWSNSGNLRIIFSPNENLNLTASARVGQTNTRYSINSSQDQVLINENYSFNLNARIAWGIFLSANMNYDRYTNDRFGFQQDVPILNASVYKVFQKKIELRISAYDLLNQNLGVNLFANSNVVSETRTTTLRRYGLLSVTYNIKGIDTRLNKQNNYY